jgi:hypothetical protein
MMVVLAVNTWELTDPEPATMAELTALQFFLYSSASGPGNSTSKKSLSQTKS